MSLEVSRLLTGKSLRLSEKFYFGIIVLVLRKHCLQEESRFSKTPLGTIRRSADPSWGHAVWTGPLPQAPQPQSPACSLCLLGAVLPLTPAAELRDHGCRKRLYFFCRVEPHVQLWMHVSSPLNTLSMLNVPWKLINGLFTFIVQRYCQPLSCSLASCFWFFFFLIANSLEILFVLGWIVTGVTSLQGNLGCAVAPFGLCPPPGRCGSGAWLGLCVVTARAGVHRCASGGLSMVCTETANSSLRPPISWSTCLKWTIFS